MENKGQDVNRPPLFKGVRYDYWKQIMSAFDESYHVICYMQQRMKTTFPTITILMRLQEKDGLMSKSKDTC